MDILRMALNDPAAKIRLARLGLRGTAGREGTSVPFVDWEILVDDYANESGSVETASQVAAE